MCDWCITQGSSSQVLTWSGLKHVSALVFCLKSQPSPGGFSQSSNHECKIMLHLGRFTLFSALVTFRSQTKD